MKRVRVAEIRRLNQAAIRDYFIPAFLLMENAGRGVKDTLPIITNLAES